jgi:hypothetical protein
MTLALRIALAIGLCIDLGVAIISLLAQGLVEPVFGVPLRDPALTLISGGEYLVVACVYLLALRDPARYRALLWLCALDQVLAIVLPLSTILRGEIDASWKTLGPLPLQFALALIYAIAARGPAQEPHRGT